MLFDYELEMNQKDEERFAALCDRVKSVEERVASLGSSPPGMEAAPQKEFILKRDPWIVAIAALLLGSGLGVNSVKWFLGDWVDHRIDAKLVEPTNALHQLQVDMSGISKRLDTFIELEKSRLERLAALPPERFSAALPQVQNALEDASALKIKSSPEVLSGLRMKLANTLDQGPAYWNSVSTFLNYNSAIRFPEVDPKSIDTLPLCFNSNPAVQFRNTTFKPSSPHSCRIELDNRSISDSVFKQVILVYRGGPAEIRNLLCSDCYLVIDLPPVPSAAAEMIARGLISSSDDVVKLGG